MSVTESCLGNFSTINIPDKLNKIRWYHKRESVSLYKHFEWNNSVHRTNGTTLL